MAHCYAATTLSRCASRWRHPMNSAAVVTAEWSLRQTAGPFSTRCAIRWRHPSSAFVYRWVVVSTTVPLQWSSILIFYRTGLLHNTDYVFVAKYGQRTDAGDVYINRQSCVSFHWRNRRCRNFIGTLLLLLSPFVEKVQTLKNN